MLCLAYSDSPVTGLHRRLAANLLEQGERTAVIEFLERMANVNVAHRLVLRETAAAVRRGQNPPVLPAGSSDGIPIPDP